MELLIWCPSFLLGHKLQESRSHLLSTWHSPLCLEDSLKMLMDWTDKGHSRGHIPDHTPDECGKPRGDSRHNLTFMSARIWGNNLCPCHLETTSQLSFVSPMVPCTPLGGKQRLVDYRPTLPPPTTLSFLCLNYSISRASWLAFWKLSLTVDVNFHLITCFVDNSHSLLTLNLILAFSYSANIYWKPSWCQECARH